MNEQKYNENYFMQKGDYFMMNIMKYRKLCGCFGNPDGTDGSCHYCLNNNKELWLKCNECNKVADIRKRK